MSAKVAFFFRVCGVFLIFLAAGSLCAKPMRTPTLSEGIALSKWIVVAEYVDYQLPVNEKVGYFSPPKAKFRITKILKGGELPPEITVTYAFHDGSACVEPSETEHMTTKQLEELLPKKGDVKILILRDQETTYRGNFGRLEATPENLKKIEAELGKKK